MTGEVILPGDIVYQWSFIHSRRGGYWAKERPPRWWLYNKINRHFYRCFEEMDKLKPSDGISKWKEVYQEARAGIPEALENYRNTLASPTFKWHDEETKGRMEMFVKEVEAWLPRFDAELEYIQGLQEVAFHDWPNVKSRHDEFCNSVPQYP